MFDKLFCKRELFGFRYTVKLIFTEKRVYIFLSLFFGVELYMTHLFLTILVELRYRLWMLVLVLLVR